MGCIKMTQPRRTASYDHEQLLHERNVLGLKKTPGDEVHPQDTHLDWLNKTTNEAGQQVYDSKPLGVAMFGLGRIGTIHLEGVLANPRIALKYCVEDFAERANFTNFVWKLKDRNVQLVTSAEMDAVLADPAVEAVLVCTPTAAHENIVLAALNAGKAVFCEKVSNLCELCSINIQLSSITILHFSINILSLSTFHNILQLRSHLRKVTKQSSDATLSLKRRTCRSFARSTGDSTLAIHNCTSASAPARSDKSTSSRPRRATRRGRRSRI